MAKLTLTDGTIFEGTTEELIALTEQFSGNVADPVAEELRVGDRVEIVDASVGVYHDLYDGDLGKITTTSGSFADEGKPYRVETDDDYDHFPASALRKVVADVPKTTAVSITHNGVEYTLVNRKAQEGDVVVFTESNANYITDGKPYVVEPGCDTLEFTDNDGDEITVYNSISRTPSNTLVYEPKAETLKVGDYAKILSTECQLLRGFSDGDIVEVVKNGYGEDDVDYRVKKIGGEHTGYVKKSAEFVRKATDAEVAEAKVDAVFTQVGRKPNEYREGDIVRVVEEGTHDYVEGDVLELAHPSDNIGYQSKARYINGEEVDKPYVFPREIEIIVFAESRLDLRK